MTSPKIRLVLLFGGRSAEHEVSCISAVSVLQALDPDRYEVLPVGITPDGRWVLAEDAQKLLAGGRPLALPVALEARGPEIGPLETIESHGGDAGEAPVVVLPLLHGPFGEDGTVQGLCELAGAPYVGSGVLASAVGMDKATTKRLVAQAGLPQVRYLALSERDLDDNIATRVTSELGWPVFVKPSNLGSSVGVSKVAGPAELTAALDDALAYDEWVLIEEAVDAREIECGVLGDVEPEASVPGEIRPSREFYDYDDKYLAGEAELVVPAPLSAAVAAEVQRTAVAVFKIVRAEGMARVDFFYEEGGRGLLVNEINTIPGFTPVSMFPLMWEASGVSYAELVDRLVGLALERHGRRRRTGRGRRLGPSTGAPPDR